MRTYLALLLLAAAVRAPAAPAHVLDDRLAAYHRAIVAIHEARPNAGLTTYVTDHFNYMQAYGLAKLVVGVDQGGRTLWPSSAADVRVEDIPGGVTATYRLGSTRVRADIRALPYGRGAAGEEGAALFSVRATPPGPVLVRCGDGQLLDMGTARSRAAWLQSDAVGADSDSASMTGGGAVLRSTVHPFVVAVRADAGAAATEPGDGGGQRAAVRFAGGTGRLVLGFARDEARARALAGADAAAALQAHDRYYRGLLQARIETPEPVMDQAFRAAILTLDYNWLQPYGWVECIHHWMSLWHMQHSPAAEWLGQEDRSRDCILSHAARLLPGGAVPQLSPGGITHRDFGGSNQFFAWQVRHYWLQTADRAAARHLAPVLDRVIEQTWTECDPDGNGLLAWGQQIGNQEDYVATPFDGTSPTVEGIQMLRTRAMLARAMGDTRRAEECDRRAATLVARMRAALWQPDLGRFAFYADPTGAEHPEGQYHTLLYPAIWGLLDPLDTYTGVRHMRDRLTGAGGEVYCSSNFPWHAVGTWGMQAGEAQQPWAAWGLAAAGLRNETFRPLRAGARWAMDANHRGAWPEVSVESTPSYFSPPAGLYIQATVEALFGLTVDRPAGVMQVAPSFPDVWPWARLRLPRYRAAYQHTGDTWQYTVETAEPLARDLAWRLPPGRVVRATANGAPLRYSLAPGVDCVVLSAHAPAARVTTFRVVLRPSSCRLEHAASIAEGDALRVTVTGGSIVRVDDRCGVTSAREGGTFTIRQGLLRPYEGFGRLGRMNFARRTFFLLCRAADGSTCWRPVNVTVLPRYEAAPIGQVADGPGGGSVHVRIRNNTARSLSGTAILSSPAGNLPFALNVPPRADRDVTFAVPRDRLALFSPGDNQARVLLPGATEVGLTLTASAVYEREPALAAWAAARVTPVPLPEDALQPDDRWRDWRDWLSYGHWPWAGSRPPLEALAGRAEVTVPGLPCVRFAPAGRKLVPVSRRPGRPTFTLDLAGRTARKLYLLVVPFLDNHDTFSSVARVTVEGENGALRVRTLHFPGDLDWWCPQEVVGQFATALQPRPDRFGLLSRLGPADADWPEARPPAFPQPEFWATCLPLKTVSSVMNVVEIDLGGPMAVRRLTVSTVGASPALGIVAVSVEQASGHAALAGTPWMPPAWAREPRTLFRLDQAGDTEGWTLEGRAFGVAPVAGLFADPTLNSLAGAGETSTGKAVSPPFKLDGRWLRFRFQGGRSKLPAGPGCLALRLVDAATGEVLASVEPPGTHVPQETALEVGKWRGRTVRIELVDENTDPSYAWIGLSRVRLTEK